VAQQQFYPPNTLQYYGVPEVGGYSTVAPLRYLKFIKFAYGDYHITVNGMLFLFHGNLDVLRTMNVKYLISDRELDHRGIRLVDSGPSYRLYQFKDPLPRAYCASDEVVFADDDALLRSFATVAGSYDRPVARLGKGPGHRPLAPQCQVRELVVHLNNLSFTVVADRATRVVVPYNYAAGWRAHNQAGQRLELERANFTFMSVAVPAGTTRVTMQYEERDLLWFSGAQLALGLIVIVLLGVGGIRWPQHAPMLLAAMALIVVSLFDVPGIRNDDVPERPSVSERERI
jgi:hypothetical protein